MRTDAGPDRLVLTAWGRTLAVEVPAGRLAKLAILPRLPFGWRPGSDHGVAERTWTLVADGATVLAGGERGRVSHEGPFAGGPLSRRRPACPVWSTHLSVSRRHPSGATSHGRSDPLVLVLAAM